MYLGASLHLMILDAAISEMEGNRNAVTICQKYIEIHRNTQTESNWTLNWFRIWEVSSGSQRMDIEIELMQNPMYFHIFLTHQERMPNSPDSSLTQQVHRKQSYAWVPLRNMPGLGWPLNLQLSFVGETTGIQSTFYVADCCRAYEPDITWPSERELWIELA